MSKTRSKSKTKSQSKNKSSNFTPRSSDLEQESQEESQSQSKSSSQLKSEFFPKLDFSTDVAEGFQGEFLKAQKVWFEEIRQTASNWNGCEIDSFVEDIELLLNKESVSDSIVLFGTIPSSNKNLGKKILYRDERNLQRITAKISFPPKLSLNNGLDVERSLLQEAFNRLYTENHTTNVVLYLGNVICDKDDGNILNQTNPNYKIYQHLLQKLKASSKLDTPLKAKVLFMENVPDGSLYQLMQKIINETIEDFSLSDFVAILLQVYWTLACFARMGIRHNDLHLNNILVRKLSKAEDLIFELENGEHYLIRTKYLIKIFDMDRGSMYYPHIPRNLTDDLDYCKSSGECNAPSEVFDVGGFNMAMIKQLQNVKSAKFSQIFDTQTLLIDLIGDSNWQSFRTERYPQYWVHRIQENESRLFHVKHPFECFEKILNKFQIPTIFETKLNAFRLPEQRFVTHGNPTFDMLPANHYNGIEPATLKVSQNISLADVAKIGLLTFFRMLDKAGKRALAWNALFDIWQKELKQSDLRYQWTSAANQLYQKTVQHTKIASNNATFMAACLTLSCPMYYGLNENNKDKCLKLFGEVKDIKEYELFIWNTWDKKLPILVPLLYNGVN